MPGQVGAPVAMAMAARIVALMVAAAILGATAPASAPAWLLLRATQTGGRTLDEGTGGGNPFATALIENLQREGATLPDLSSRLRARTQALSDDFQDPDVPPRESFPLLPLQQRGTPGVALVIAFTTYRMSGVPSLPGAARDSRRVAAALTSAGFRTELLVDPSRKQLASALAKLERVSPTASVALIYATGHGAEVNKITYLLPPDYPVASGETALSAAAVRVSDLGRALRGTAANLLLYAGCRDDPFATGFEKPGEQERE